MNLATNMVRAQSIRLDEISDQFGFEMTQLEKMQFIAKFAGAGTPDDLQTALSTDITEVVLPKNTVPQLVDAGAQDDFGEDYEIEDQAAEGFDLSPDVSAVFSTTNGFTLSKVVDIQSEEVSYSVDNARGERVLSISPRENINAKLAFSQILEAMDIDRVTRLHNAVVAEIANLQPAGATGNATFTLGTVNAKMAIKKQAIEVSHLFAAKGIEVSTEQKCSVLSSLNGTSPAMLEQVLGINLREQFESANIQSLSSASTTAPLTQKHLLFSSGGALIANYNDSGEAEAIRFNNMVGMEVARLNLAEFQNLDEILEATARAFRNEHIAASSRIQEAYTETMQGEGALDADHPEPLVEELDEASAETTRNLLQLLERGDQPNADGNDQPPPAPVDQSEAASTSDASAEEAPEKDADRTTSGPEMTHADVSGIDQQRELSTPPDVEDEQTRRKRGPRQPGF